MKAQEDPPHRIIERPHEYEIVSLCFYREVQGEPEPFIDLTLRKGQSARLLRFLNVQGLEIENGFPAQTGGMVIYDVSARGMEGLGVRVDDFEAGRGAVRFWARAVIEPGQFAGVVPD